MTRIGVVGFGYVGQAFARMFYKQVGRYQIEVLDPFIDEIKDKTLTNVILVDSYDDINTCEMVLVSVPTPSDDMGGCDTSIVEDVISKINGPVIMIKSTIKPGTTDKLKAKYPDKKIIFSPEYVGEGRYYVTARMDFQTDMIKTPFLIVGGDDADCNAVLDLLIPVLGPEKEYFKCTPIEAEIIKYMENTYFATKITFAQEMYNIVRAHGADWYRVWHGWSLDPRVDIMHTAVFPKERGFSGKCLPKDVNALVKSSIEHGYTPDLLIEVLKTNAKVRPDEPVRLK